MAPSRQPGLSRPTRPDRGVGGLTPCTGYHFKLLASSTSGATGGSDQSFTTGFANPIASVKSPGKVKQQHRFTLKLSLSSSASVTVLVTHHGHVVQTHGEGTHAGTVTVSISAPRKKGKYGVRIVAKESCGQQTISKQLKVH